MCSGHYNKWHNPRLWSCPGWTRACMAIGCQNDNVVRFVKLSKAKQSAFMKWYKRWSRDETTVIPGQKKASNT
jgi:hypothetical protein